MNTKKVNYALRVLSAFSVRLVPPIAHDNVRAATTEQTTRFDTVVPIQPNHCHHFHWRHKRVSEEGTGKCGYDMLHSSLAARRQMKLSDWTGGLALKGAWSWRLAAAAACRCLNIRGNAVPFLAAFYWDNTNGLVIRYGHRLFFSFQACTSFVKLKDNLFLSAYVRSGQPASLLGLAFSG